MKTPEPRDEAAAIVRSLVRRLERERAAGGGDLIARGATHAGSRRTRAQAPVAPPVAATVAAPVAAPAEEFDLFGRAVPRSVGKAPATAAPPAPEEAPLNPAGWEAREAVTAAAAPVLEQIAAEVRACRKCALWESRAQAVPGVGGARSGIVFVGEAPGADEDRLGEPFVGRAGQLLDKIIQAMNDAHLIPGVPLTRETVFIGNIIHCRPPENRVPLPFEIEQSSPYLRRQLEALRPRIVCCLGKTAAEFLLGAKGSLGGMRGKVYRYQGAKLIVTYHPAACLRNPDYKRPVWEDMQFLAREYLSNTSGR
jgi:uracil-DNA glycosylase